MSLIWNEWIGYTKPLMDFRNDGPAPSWPDNPSESFWHSCAPSTEVDTSQFDGAWNVVPTLFDGAVAVTSTEFDVVN